MSTMNPDVMDQLGEQAGLALAERLEKEGRLRPGVTLDPDVAATFKALVSGAHMFAMMNGADDGEAVEAMNLYAVAVASALSFRAATRPAGTIH